MFKFGDGLVDGAGVADYVISGVSFQVQRELAGLSLFQFPVVPSAIRHNPLEPGTLRGIDEDHGVAQIAPTGLEEDGRIEEDGLDTLGRLRLLNLLLESSPDFRMHDLFQVRSVLPVLFSGSENQMGEGRTENVSLRVEHRFAEPVSNGMFDVGSREDLMSGRISVENEQGATFGEAASDRALSGTDTSHEADDGDRFKTGHTGISWSAGETLRRTIRCERGFGRAILPHGLAERRRGMLDLLSIVPGRGSTVNGKFGKLAGVVSRDARRQQSPPAGDPAEPVQPDGASPRCRPKRDSDQNVSMRTIAVSPATRAIG